MLRLVAETQQEPGVAVMTYDMRLRHAAVPDGFLEYMGEERAEYHGRATAIGVEVCLFFGCVDLFLYFSLGVSTQLGLDARAIHQPSGSHLPARQIRNTSSLLVLELMSHLAHHRPHFYSC